MNALHSIRAGTAWLLAGRVGSQILQFAFGIVLARLLAPAEFGLLVTIQIYTGIAGYVSGAGMATALVQASNVEDREYRVVFGLQMAIGVLIYLFFFASSTWFADWYGTPMYRDLLRVSALAFVVRPFVNVSSAILVRQSRFKAFSVVNILVLLVSGSTSIVLAWKGWGVWALVVAGLVGSVANGILGLWAARWMPGVAIDTAVARRLGVYGFQVSLNDFICYIRDQICNFIIGRQLLAHHVGLFNKADSLSRMPVSVVAGSVYQTVFRAMAEVQDNTEQCRYLYYRAIALTLIYLSPVYVGIAWLAVPLIEMLFGPRWLDAAPALRILACVGPLMIIANLSGAVAQALKLMQPEIGIQTVAAAFLAVGCWFAVGSGIEAVSWVLAIFWILFCVSMLRLVSRRLSGSFRDLVLALRPALVLNVLLVLSLVVAEVAWQRWHPLQSQLLYAIAIAAVGVCTYAIGFLFLPLQGLRSEALRWRRLLRMGCGSGRES